MMPAYSTRPYQFHSRSSQIQLVPIRFNPLHFDTARSSHVEPDAARSSDTQPEPARSNQIQPDATRSANSSCISPDLSVASRADVCNACVSAKLLVMFCLELEISLSGSWVLHVSVHLLDPLPMSRPKWRPLGKEKWQFRLDHPSKIDLAGYKYFLVDFSGRKSIFEGWS